MRVTPALRALAAALLGALLLVWPAAPASQAEVAEVASRADGDRVVFTGTFVRNPQVQVDGASVVRRYQVAVDQVFGDVDVTTQRVTVRSRLALESCGVRPSGGAQQEQATPGQPTEPATPAQTTAPSGPVDDQLRVFDTTLDGADHVITACTDVSVVDDAVLSSLNQQFGEGRPVGSAEEAPQELDEVAFLCPDTREAVGDLGDEGSCPALEDGPSFDRSAAPGAALVIVGVLGLLVVRRMGRRSRR
ncbi:MAG: hypothetical protein JWN84_1054 [Nocardioides sp.]|nr:hypothetical protein [Nocardioides sp.]